MKVNANCVGGAKLGSAVDSADAASEICCVKATLIASPLQRRELRQCICCALVGPSALRFGRKIYGRAYPKFLELQYRLEERLDPVPRDLYANAQQHEGDHAQDAVGRLGRDVFGDFRCVGVTEKDA